MPRSPTSLSPYYHVELAPDAWRGVGCFSAGDFEVLQGVMELLAVEGAPYEQGEGPHTVMVAGFHVRYTRDDVARTLTLHQVSRAQRSPSEAA
jgi:hypothetical protein